ncbi:unnamed protein product [Brassica oleracea]|uniref:Uncharacterized protein n=1 Tax=Brassica oleracea TaxID=3712 RepID=A0A3P6D2D2_BRAOL|nr:unnamed protein product [Brassica oleracea]
MESRALLALKLRLGGDTSPKKSPDIVHPPWRCGCLLGFTAQPTEENQAWITASLAEVISLFGRSKTRHDRFRRAPETTKKKWRWSKRLETEKTGTKATYIALVLKRQKTEQYG